MVDTNETDRLKRQVEMLERKRKRLFSRAGEKNSEEDSLVYSLADLMTLLLIFFILLYANSSTDAKSIFSSMAALIPGFSIQQTNAAFTLDPPREFAAEAVAAVREKTDPEKDGAPALDPPDPRMEPVIAMLDEKLPSVTPQSMEAPAFPVHEGRAGVTAPEAEEKGSEKKNHAASPADGAKKTKPAMIPGLIADQTSPRVEAPGSGAPKAPANQAGPIHPEGRKNPTHKDPDRILEAKVLPPIQAPGFPGWIDEQRLMDLKNQIPAFLDSDQGKAFAVQWDTHRLRIVLGEKITFSPGKAEILEAFHPFLKKVAAFVSSQQNLEIMVSGHTDDTPIHTSNYPSNWELSVIRAVNVAHFLSANGVNPARLTVEGYSEYRPLKSNTSADNKQANRRVEISLLKPRDRSLAVVR